MAREGGPPRLRSGRGADHRPHAHRRTARTRNPRWQADRKPRRARPVHPPVRPVEGQSHDRRRPQVRALRPLSRKPRRLPSQSGPQGLSPTPHRRRQAQNARRHRRGPQTPHHPQRHPAGQTTMAPRKRLTANTVAEAPRTGLEGRSRRRKRGYARSFPRQAWDGLFVTPRSARLVRMRSAGLGAILKAATLGVMAQLFLRLKTLALIALLALCTSAYAAESDKGVLADLISRALSSPSMSVS